MQLSADDITNITMTTVCQQRPSLVVTSAAAVDTSNAVSRTSPLSQSQETTEATALTLNGIQNSPVLVVDSSSLSTVEVQVSELENSSNAGTESDEDSDDDVVIIDADLVPLSLSRSSPKRSLAAQNVILLNHHKSSSSGAVDSKQSAPAVKLATGGMEHSRTKRKSVLSRRLLETAVGEGIILPTVQGFENGSRTSQPNRRKSFPQKRTDLSVPQLQFCSTKQWKRDASSSQVTSTSPTCKRSQSTSPKKDKGSDLLENADRSTRSIPPLLQSNFQGSNNSCNRRKRKPLDQSKSPALQDIKRLKRLSPAKSGNNHYNKKMETSVSVARKADVNLKADDSADSTKVASNSVAVTVSSCSSAASKPNCQNEVKTTEPTANVSSELQVLGKDKRSMEMSVTNEDGVVENLVVTIIDISSSSDEENDIDKVEIHSVCSSPKLDSSKGSKPRVETSQTNQSTISKSLNSNAAVKTLSSKSHINSLTSASNHQPVFESTSRTKRVRQKYRQPVSGSPMGRKVSLTQGSAALCGELADINKVKQLTHLGKAHSRNLTKAESDSVFVGSLGPVVHLRGSKDNPCSCCVVSGTRDIDDETIARSKQKLVMLSSSCYPTSFQLRDSAPWKCVFCHQGSSYRTLGDLFGPYDAKTENSTKSDHAECRSPPFKGRKHSSKKRQESGCSIVSQNSQCRRQQLQRYSSPVVRKSPQKSSTSPAKGVPSEIWLHEDCVIWTSGICLSPTGQLSGLEAAITLSLQTVYSLCCFGLTYGSCDVKACILLVFAYAQL